ncbi:MAG: diacylglycerol kinase family protein, partial [Candidatus Nanoarchaeia archaeon]
MTSKRRFAFIANSNKVDISSLKTIEKYFLDTLDDAVFYITNNENELDSIASLGADVYVALGGDGTLNSLLNALRTPSSPFKRDSLPIVGVLPFGNGDDFAQSVGFSPKHFSSKKISKQQNLQKIFEPFIQTQYNDTFVAPVYYGDFWINNDPVPKQFFSYVGLGLFAQAVKQANKKSNKSYFKELK